MRLGIPELKTTCLIWEGGEAEGAEGAEEGAEGEEAGGVGGAVWEDKCKEVQLQNK